MCRNWETRALDAGTHGVGRMTAVAGIDRPLPSRTEVA